MSSDNLRITITLIDSQSRDEELQEATVNLQQAIEEVDGVERVNLVLVEQPPPNSKSIGGYLLRVLKTEIKPEYLIAQSNAKF